MEASPSYLEFHSLARFLHQVSATRRLECPGDALRNGDKQCFHVLGVLDEIFLRHDLDQGTNRKVSPII